jgi:hypothetical protein
MSKIIRWETPFTDAFYPSVILFAIPLPPKLGIVNNVKLIVNPSKGEYPKYLVDFGEVLAFTCMDESCCPERDISSAKIDETIKNDKSICAFQWLESPWLKSYEVCHDPFSEGKFSHYLIYGGDNNVEIITQNAPEIRKVEQNEVLAFEFEL